MTQSTLGERIERARSAKGLSSSQLARRVGIASKTLAHWEADRSEPRANKLAMLAGMLDVPVVWLLAGDEAGGGIDLDVEVDETASLVAKVDALIKMHEKLTVLLFELSSDITRLQRQTAKVH
jgi:transcriptional regulator with XRE-family HTH domain